MGTSGLTAQAFGAGNFHECTNMLVRGILVAAILGLLVICFQNPLGRLALWAMNGNEIVHDYFYARIWAVPAGIMLFGFNGWYTGMQNAVIPMCIAVTVNIVHVSTSLWLVFDTAWASRASPMARSWPKIRGSCWRSCCLSCDTAKFSHGLRGVKWWTGNRCGNFSSSTATSSSVRSVS